MNEELKAKLAEIAWLDFDITTERMYMSASGGDIHRITVPARVIELRTMEATEEDMEHNDTFGTRSRLATEYAAEGDVIDTQIDVHGWGPDHTYNQRRFYGNPSVPDITYDWIIITPPDPIPTSAPEQAA
jgi:hypothetical protein